MRKSLFLCISLPLLHIHTCNFSFPLFSSRHLSNGIWQLTSSHSFFFFSRLCRSPAALKGQRVKKSRVGVSTQFFLTMCVCRRVRVAVQWPRKKFQMPRNLSFNGNFVCVCQWEERSWEQQSWGSRKHIHHKHTSQLPFTYLTQSPTPYRLYFPAASIH